MEKIEVLLKKDLCKSFDTPKKLNRSNKAIAPAVINDLENGLFTCEAIDQLSQSFPIFHYRTCITVHGHWPTIERTRVGGYKNVHQNLNGSVEVRYSAIDNEKIERICQGITIDGCKYRYHENSNERSFSWAEEITKENFNQVRARMEPHAQTLARYTVMLIYISVGICSVNFWFYPLFRLLYRKVR